MWWYILENNVPQSGINDDQIIAAVKSGRVTAGTLLATDQGPEWRPAAEYPALAAALAGASVTPEAAAGSRDERPKAATPVSSGAARSREPAGPSAYEADDFGRDFLICHDDAPG